MYIKFFLFANMVFLFVNSVSCFNHHRINANNRQQISSYDKNNLKPVMKVNNERSQIQLQLHSKNKTMSDRLMKKMEEETVIPWNLRNETDRLQFQIQHHKGPQTYIFGFDTGYGKNRQYRMEERHRNGTIKGQYGYYDANGKLKTVRYVATPSEGYSEIHLESNILNLIN